MKVRLIIVGLAATALAIAGPVVAHASGWKGHGDWGAGPGRAGMVLLRMADKLGLSDQQRSQIKLAIDQAGQALAPLQGQLKAGRQAFVSAHDPAKFDEAAVRGEFAKQSSIREEMAVIRARARAQALSILTPEQRDQLKQLRAQWAQKHGRPHAPVEK
jgi:Spy/CpxP family protein refolding chaperone